MPKRTKPASRIQPIRMGAEVLELLDQRCLPRQERYIKCRTVGEVVRAIRNMTVRGAPAIGVTAAYGLALGALRSRARQRQTLLAQLARDADRLKAARPTAVNLQWAVDRMLRHARQRQGSPTQIARELLRLARRMHTDDVEANRRIGRHGQALLPTEATVLTHCNAGALATAGYGTALGVIRAAVEAGKRVSVIADETRPFLQGARLTAWELHRDGIDVTLAADVAAGHLMSRGRVQAVVVGADRIAMNGDVANKIGTYPVACLARRHRIPFYVAAPVSTIDPSIRTGRSIPIEERTESEVLSVFGKPVAPAGVHALNPAFDVTPARLVTAIITDQGVLRPPFGRSLAALSFSSD